MTKQCFFLIFTYKQFFVPCFLLFINEMLWIFLEPHQMPNKVKCVQFLTTRINMLKFTIYNLPLKFVSSCTGLFTVGKRIPKFCREIFKRVQPMGCGPRFRQCKNVAAPKIVVNRAEAKHLLQVV